MSTDTSTRKKALIAAVSDELLKGAGKRQAAIIETFLDHCFLRVPYADLAGNSPSSLAAIVNGQVGFMQRRVAGELRVRVFNPSIDSDGWESDHTVVELVNDDRPFLVDSASLALTEMGIGIHLVVHPVVRVDRDDDGDLLRVYPRGEEGGQAESMIQLHIEKHTDRGELDAIRARLVAAMVDVRRAVDDWQAMVAAVKDAVELMPGWAPGVKKTWMAECQEFMRWLIDDNFVLLGVRDYAVRGKGDKATLNVVGGSGLGILRGDSDTRRSRPVADLAPEARRLSQKRPLIVTKTNARSTVHRAGFMDYIGVLRIDDEGRTVGERRIIGLFTSRAYNQNAMKTPMLRVRTRNILDRADLLEGSHAWRTMVHILESLPRDELFQATTRQLRRLAEGVLDLQERKLVRLFIRKERYGRFYSCLAYIPREQFNTENRETVQTILGEALQGERIDYTVKVAESSLARLQVLVRPRAGAEVEFDVAALERKIAAGVRSWGDELRAILVKKNGEEIGLDLFERFGRAFPEAYKEDVSPWVAAFDVVNAAAVDEGGPLRMSLYKPREPRGGIIRFKLFRGGAPIPLSHVLPILENLGLHIVNERPYELEFPDGKTLWIQDFDMQPVQGDEIDLDVVRELFEEAFRRTLLGDAENDGFNRLVIGSQMHWRQVAVLRAYCKYLQQTNIPFSATYMADSVARHPGMSRVLIELFEARFDPARGQESTGVRKEAQQSLEGLLKPIFENDCRADPGLRDYIDELVKARMGSRADQIDAARRVFRRGLQFVTSLDEDRILYAFYEVIGATLRTSYYQRDGHGQPRDYMSFKLDSGALPELPKPRPFREIWVYSPRVEGVHLRGGMIARGGLRWSDRREDFRTEVLGLVKAQNVKNTVIVPVGAKGGFVVKKPPTEGGRAAMFAEGVECYKKFINGLLDITDNLNKDIILPPEDVVRLDGDDPYLVVAADKGTATFSDIANGVAAEHGHWLGDAFASGGSVGYDHKAMGITARGAWEAVKLHFREMGVNTQKEPFTVVGIGDMAGDVFGNGMLLSRHIRLKAAFNHIHIFLDPDPDEKASYAERRRLFHKAGSTWMDYRPELISKGGGVFSRTDKTVPLSREIRDWLGIAETEISPNALIKALLKSEVDLLWNGGIGTYVKAASETHADVGDLANNALRVNGNELRCQVVGEGGNLGMTQLGRIEYAQAGGRLNTDFIDNSAGVDTSDHEVNIKILLNQVVARGRLGAEKRKALLVEMSDEVAAQVLRNTYLQTQAISMMKAFSAERLGSMGHFIDVLEDAGSLDRALEFLPDEEELLQRRDRGEGMTRPELAVLLSYAKITLYRELLDSNVPEDSWLSEEAVNYFPMPIRERYARYVPTHRLKREIIATQVTNSLVNRMGASFVMRMREDTGKEACDVARAYTIAREIFEARDFWRSVENLDNRVASECQIAAMLNMWTLLRQATRWLLNLPHERLEIGQMLRRLAPGMKEMEKIIRGRLTDTEKEQLHQRMAYFVDGGFSRRLAARAAILEHLYPALDVVETAARRRTGVERVARVSFGLVEALELHWLRRQIESLEVSGQWHAMSRANLRDELATHHNRLVERVLAECGRKKDPAAAWLQAHGKRAEEVSTMLSRMRKQAEMDYATLSVAVRALGQLADDPSNEQ
jgi:glutamate dehydrogenase